MSTSTHNLPRLNAVDGEGPDRASIGPSYESSRGAWVTLRANCVPIHHRFGTESLLLVTHTSRDRS